MSYPERVIQGVIGGRCGDHSNRISKPATNNITIEPRMATRDARVLSHDLVSSLSEKLARSAIKSDVGKASIIKVPNNSCIQVTISLVSGLSSFHKVGEMLFISVFDRATSGLSCYMQIDTTKTGAAT